MGTYRNGFFETDFASARPQRQGFLHSPTSKPVVLCSKVREEGRLCVRRHRLAERLLVDVLGVKSKIVHETGCKLEHILNKGLEDNICILLGHPKTCPHGMQIPQGQCCKKKKSTTESFVIPLSSMSKGQKGKIAYIHINKKTPVIKRLESTSFIF